MNVTKCFATILVFSILNLNAIPIEITNIDGQTQSIDAIPGETRVRDIIRAYSELNNLRPWSIKVCNGGCLLESEALITDETTSLTVVLQDSSNKDIVEYFMRQRDSTIRFIRNPIIADDCAFDIIITSGSNSILFCIIETISLLKVRADAYHQSLDFIITSHSLEELDLREIARLCLLALIVNVDFLNATSFNDLFNENIDKVTSQVVLFMRLQFSLQRLLQRLISFPELMQTQFTPPSQIEPKPLLAYVYDVT